MVSQLFVIAFITIAFIVIALWKRIPLFTLIASVLLLYMAFEFRAEPMLITTFITAAIAVWYLTYSMMQSKN